MSSTYNHKTIEEIIQNKWNEEKRYVSKIDKREKYIKQFLKIVNWDYCNQQLMQ